MWRLKVRSNVRAIVPDIEAAGRTPSVGLMPDTLPAHAEKGGGAKIGNQHRQFLSIPYHKYIIELVI